MATLEREKYVFNAPSAELEQEFTTLGEKARELFGYGQLAAHAMSERFRVATFSRLADTLNKLSIEPINKEKVERYKKAEVRRANLHYKLWDFCQHERMPHIVVYGCWAGAMPTIAAALQFGHKFHHLLWVIPAIQLLFSAFVIVFGLNERMAEFSWQQTDLKYYASPVPAFALDRACALKTELPEATFYVDHLTSRNVLKDPFMVMNYHGKHFYLDVWEEPKFEGRRTK